MITPFCAGSPTRGSTLSTANVPIRLKARKATNVGITVACRRACAEAWRTDVRECA